VPGPSWYAIQGAKEEKFAIRRWFEIFLRQEVTVTSANQHISPEKALVLPQLQGIDYVELYVGNAHQAAQYYRTAFGFTPIAYAGLETGLRDQASVLLQQEESYLVLTAPLGSEGPIADYVLRHGDGVRDIAFRVEDAQQAFEAATRSPARPLCSIIQKYRSNIA